MLTATIVLIIFVCILLVVVVLAQDSKGGGLVSQTGASQLMGVKKTTDIMERLTWGFAISIMVLSISTGFMTGVGEEEGPASINIEAAKTKKTDAPAPQQPTTVQPQQGTGEVQPTADSGK